MSTLGSRAVRAGDEAHGLRPGVLVAQRYELIELLRTTHLGARWAAWDQQLERRVTLKVVAPHAVADPVAGEWLKRESLATARLHHPNVLQLYDVHDTAGTMCLVLEDIEGPSLEDIGCGPFPADLVAALGHQVASGLAAAHELRIVHRDIRPANLLLAPSGHVKIANFTLSKLLDASGQDITVETSLRDQFGYVAPEQLADAPVTTSADVYALGLILWEAMNGHLPWYETDPLPAAALRRMHEPLPPATTMTDVADVRLAEIVDHATRPDPADRYPTASALADDLHEICGARSHALTRNYLLGG